MCIREAIRRQLSADSSSLDFRDQIVDIGIDIALAKDLLGRAKQ